MTETLEGDLEMWESEGGFGPPDIAINAEDLAVWLAAKVGVTIAGGRGWTLPREGILGRVRLTVEVLEVNA